MTFDPLIEEISSQNQALADFSHCFLKTIAVAIEKKIALSIKAIAISDSRGDFSSFGNFQGEATSNLGELLKEELKKK